MLRRKVFAAALAGLVWTPAIHATTSVVSCTPLVSFATGAGGNSPTSGVVLDPAGDIFGTTSLGGSNNNSGVVYEIAAGSHAYSVVASFPVSTGINPPSIGASTLTIDPAGNLYGTTDYGGNASAGSIFKIAAGGHSITTLASFQLTSGNAGDYPGVIGQLLRDPAGNLYGTATSGGSGGSGTVFELPAGSNTITQLASFNSSDGALPFGNVSMDAAMNIYGVTGYGGLGGDGTAFEIGASNHSLSTLVNFNGLNGRLPYAGILSDSAGNLYGTTQLGGLYGDGTLFKVSSTTHALATLVNFNVSNGQDPDSPLIFDGAGNLFGTTNSGGTNNEGTLFEFNLVSGQLTTLVSFNGSTGAQPYSQIASDAAGNLYGSTFTLGLNTLGTVYEASGTGFVPIPEPASLAFAAAAPLLLVRRRTPSPTRTDRI